MPHFFFFFGHHCFFIKKIKNALFYALKCESHHPQPRPSSPRELITQMTNYSSVIQDQNNYLRYHPFLEQLLKYYFLPAMTSSSFLRLVCCPVHFILRLENLVSAKKEMTSTDEATLPIHSFNTCHAVPGGRPCAMGWTSFQHVFFAWLVRRICPPCHSITSGKSRRGTMKCYSIERLFDKRGDDRKWFHSVESCSVE